MCAACDAPQHVHDGHVKQLALHDNHLVCVGVLRCVAAVARATRQGCARGARGVCSRGPLPVLGLTFITEMAL